MASSVVFARAITIVFLYLKNCHTVGFTTCQRPAILHDQQIMTALPDLSCAIKILAFGNFLRNHNPSRPGHLAARIFAQHRERPPAVISNKLTTYSLAPRDKFFFMANRIIF